MRIREFEAKEILKSYGIPVPHGFLIRKESDLSGLLERMSFPVIAKAQLPIGKRGKLGGIKVARDERELFSVIRELLGSMLSEGSGIVEEILIEEFVDSKHEFYLGITVDRRAGSISLLTGKKGGIDVEEAFYEDSSGFLIEEIDIRYGLQDYKARKAFSFLGVPSNLLDEFVRIVKNLYRIFRDQECILCEINPLAFSDKSRFVALDAKIVLDDNALFRHRDLFSKLNLSFDDQGLSYVKLKGNVGIIANGAGLAMATMDLVKQSGLEPSNFLDVGGGANEERIAQGIRLVHEDPQCKVIFSNIFGGILRCDTFVRGLISFYPNLTKPFVLRLSGTNLNEALNLLKQNNLTIPVFTELKEALGFLVEKVRDVNSRR